MFANTLNKEALKWIQDNISTTDMTTPGVQLKDLVEHFSRDVSDIDPNTFAKILKHQFNGQFQKRRLGSGRITHYVGLCLVKSQSPDQTTDVGPTPATDESNIIEDSSQAHLAPFVDTPSPDISTGDSINVETIIMDGSTCFDNENVFIYEVGMSNTKVRSLQRAIQSKGGKIDLFLDKNTTCILFDKKGILASLSPQTDFDKLYNYGKKLVDTSYFHISLLADKETPTCTPYQTVDSQTLKSPLIKIEDMSGMYRPVYKEFTDSEWTSCTSFLSTQHDNILHRPQNVQNRKGPSYCECCCETYLDLISHCTSCERHIAFVSNQDNYKKLDECIKENPLGVWLSKEQR